MSQLISPGTFCTRYRFVFVSVLIPSGWKMFSMLIDRYENRSSCNLLIQTLCLYYKHIVKRI